MKHSRLVRSASDEDLDASDDEVVTSRARYIAKTGTAREFMPDNGDGTYTVYRIEDMGIVELYDSKNPGTVPGKRVGEFYQGDSYIIKYETTGDRHQYVIYYWLGKDSSQDEIAAAAIFAVNMDNDLNGAAVLVRVPQGEEPRHFLHIFKGELVTHLGGKGSGFKNLNLQDSYDTDGVRLFRIYGNRVREDMRALQVSEEASSLHSDDVFILETPEKVFLWNGKDASNPEKEEGPRFVQKILGDVSFEILEQGDEGDDFWKYLGDSSSVKPEPSWRNKLGKRIHSDAQLFEVTMKSDSSIKFDPIPNYSQKDLHADEVYVLDVGDVVYIWVGSEVESQYKAGHTYGENYLLSEGKNPFESIVIVIKQGLEGTFTSYFEKWDRDWWAKRPSYEDAKIAAINDNSVY